MSRKKSKELMEQGREALRAGAREQAADLLKQAVEEYEENIDAWELLVQALTDNAERNIALTTILQLDPDNRFAREQMLGGGGMDNVGESSVDFDVVEQQQAADKAKQDKRAPRAPGGDLMPGVSRREATIVGGGLVALTLLMCVVVFSFQNSTNAARDANRRSLTRVAQEGTAVIETVNARETSVAQTATQAAVDFAETVAASFTPPSPTPRTPTFFPTFTPSPTATEVTFRVEPPPPADVTGSIYGWGGRNPSSDLYLNLRRYDLRAGGDFERISSSSVRFVAGDAQGTRLVFQSLLPRGGWTLTELELAIGVEESLSSFWTREGIQDSRQPKLSSDGRLLVFSATDMDSGRSHIYLVNLATFDPINLEVLQLTSDEAEYSTPAVSPDGNTVVAVRTANGAADLVLIDASNPEFPQTPLTVNGVALTESHPAFSADGGQVIFEAYRQDADNHDIYLIPTIAQGGEIAIVTTPDDERYPLYDPQGRFIAFSRQALASYDIFIFELATNSTYQLSDDEFDVFAGAWVR